MDYKIEEQIIKDIKKHFRQSKCSIKRERRIEVILDKKNIVPFALRMQKDWDFPHLSAISCVDWIDENKFELVYHFWSYNKKVLVSAKIKIPRKNEAHAESIAYLWQPAKFFERDIHEMFGIIFDGNDELEKYILTDWDGPPPMRKDFITREFALNFYSYREYNPEWLQEITKQGEQNG